MEIKNDLSSEVRTLTKRMSHIDEQISQIFNVLSPQNKSLANTFIPIAKPIPMPPVQIASPTQPTRLSPLQKTLSLESTVGSVAISPLFEAPSFYSDLNSKMTIFDASQPASPLLDAHEIHRQSRTSEQIVETPPIRQISGSDSTALSIPPPPSVYNRSATSSIIGFGTSTTSRGSVSNKIAPAPVPSSPVSPKHPLNTTFQPISNTRLNPGRSPKPKARLYHSRTSSKHQQQYPERSTIIELEPSTQDDASSKNVPSLSTSNKTTPTIRSSGSVFRRFMQGGGGGSTEKTTMSSSSSTLLYPPTSDDERPMSPVSSGNDDDDYRPLTSSSKYHHQTPL
jgi:hypothetical protein